MPVLTELNRVGRGHPPGSGLAFCYPFVDAVVGTTPVEARNLHTGDYTNLKVQADLKLQTVLQGLPEPPGGGGGAAAGGGVPERLPESCPDRWWRRWRCGLRSRPSRTAGGGGGGAAAVRRWRVRRRPAVVAWLRRWRWRGVAACPAGGAGGGGIGGGGDGQRRRRHRRRGTASAPR